MPTESQFAKFSVCQTFPLYGISRQSLLVSQSLRHGSEVAYTLNTLTKHSTIIMHNLLYLATGDVVKFFICKIVWQFSKRYEKPEQISIILAVTNVDGQTITFLPKTYHNCSHAGCNTVEPLYSRHPWDSLIKGVLISGFLLYTSPCNWDRAWCLA